MENLYASPEILGKDTKRIRGGHQTLPIFLPARQTSFRQVKCRAL